MSQTARAGDEPAPDEAPSAESFARVICEQVSVLHGVSTMLEATLAQELSQAEPLTPEGLRSLQRLDFMRQSLKDIEVILTTVAPGLAWQPGYVPREERLRAAVSMHASVDSFFSPRSTRHSASGDEPEVWL